MLIEWLEFMFKRFLISIFAVVLCGSAVIGQTKPLRIISQLKPALPKDYGQLDVRGSIVLKVEFLADGKIGRVVLVSHLTKDLDELAIEAAKRIKFRPKNKDRRPVDSFATVEYNFTWHGWETPPRK